MATTMVHKLDDTASIPQSRASTDYQRQEQRLMFCLLSPAIAVVTLLLVLAHLALAWRIHRRGIA